MIIWDEGVCVCRCDIWWMIIWDEGVCVCRCDLWWMIIWDEGVCVCIEVSLEACCLSRGMLLVWKNATSFFLKHATS